MKYPLILGCTVALVFLAQTAVAESSTTTEEIAQTRTALKENKSNDVSRLLEPFNRAIQLNPSDAKAYRNRGALKYTLLNDIPGALADFNKAIALLTPERGIELNPRDADAYYNRGFLKADKLNDRAGAIQDYRQAARLYREQGNASSLRYALDQLKKLGATE